jgi:hypothetical protein
VQRLREVADHREHYNLLGHEQVHPDYLVVGKFVAAFDYDLLPQDHPASRGNEAYERTATGLILASTQWTK